MACDYDVKATRRILYIDKNHPLLDPAAHTLDVYSPCISGSRSRVGSSPIALYFPGGAWMFGDTQQTNVRTIGEQMASRGIVTACVQYRRSSLSSCACGQWAAFIVWILAVIVFLVYETPVEQVSGGPARKVVWVLLLILLSLVFILLEVRMFERAPYRHPCHISDCANAVGWMYRHAREFGGDPSKLFIMGHSAGGHLATLLGTCDAYWKWTCVPKSALRGIISISGVYSAQGLCESYIGRQVMSVAFPKCFALPMFPDQCIKDDDCRQARLLVICAQYEFGLKTQARRYVQQVRRCTRRKVCAWFYQDTTHFSIVSQWDGIHAGIRNDIVRFILCTVRSDAR